MSDFLSTLLTIAVVFCAVSFFLSALLTGVVIWQVRKLFNASSKELVDQYETIRAQRPTVSDETIIQQIAKSQAQRCGVIGVFTSVGGFVTLLFMLPVDIYLTTRIQSRLVKFIAQHYNQPLNPDDPGLSEIRDNIQLTPEAQVRRGGARLRRETSEFIWRKVIAKFVPFVGAILGYLFNYREARETGKVALDHFASRPAAAD
jgi:cell division protein FtsL